MGFADSPRGAYELLVVTRPYNKAGRRCKNDPTSLSLSKLVVTSLARRVRDGLRFGRASEGLCLTN